MNKLRDALYGQNTCTPNPHMGPWIDPNQSTGNPPLQHSVNWIEAERQRREIERLTREYQDRSFLPTPEVRPKTTLRFKGVVFIVRLEKHVLDFFEDEKDIQPDEMRLLGITYPEEHKQIKEAWISAWKDLQATRAFESD